MGVSKIYPSLCCSRSVTPSTTEKVLTLCNVKEIHQYLFSLFHARDKRKEKTFFSVSSSSVKLTIILILFKNKPLSTSLLMAVCRTRVIYELRNGPYPPKSFCGQARNPKVWGLISHVDPEFFFVLRLWQDENNIFLYFSIEPKTYHLSKFQTRMFHGADIDDQFRSQKLLLRLLVSWKCFVDSQARL